PPPRTGWWACPREGASPWAGPWSRGGSGCRARRPGTRPSSGWSLRGPLSKIHDALGKRYSLAREGLLDAPPELGLRGEAADRLHLDHETQAEVAAVAEAHDALDLGRLEGQPAVPRPVGADRLEDGEGPTDVGLLSDGHVDHRPRPALVVVDELGDLAV